MRYLFQCCLLVWTVFVSTQVVADAGLMHRPGVQHFIREMVSRYHFDKRQIVAILNEAHFQPQIIESMERPYEKKTWDVYRDLFLTAERVQSGIAFWFANQKALQHAEQQFGVPAEVIVAILGVETLYGKHQGNYRVLDALTTLAFYYPKRQDFFRKELKEYLLLCREHKVPATQYMGSYAGAIGKPQFMPSSYRFYAIDSQGKGRANLVSEDSDIIHSVANYFYKHGWKNHDLVAQPALVSGEAYKLLTTNSKFPDYSYQRLVASGVAPTIQMGEHPAKAGLIELTTKTGPEFWLAYPNFYVITRYNTSPQYALVVYLLSQQLNQQWAKLQHIQGTQLNNAG